MYKDGHSVFLNEKRQITKQYDRYLSFVKLFLGIQKNKWKNVNILGLEIKDFSPILGSFSPHFLFFLNDKITVLPVSRKNKIQTTENTPPT